LAEVIVLSSNNELEIAAGMAAGKAIAKGYQMIHIEKIWSSTITAEERKQLQIALKISTAETGIVLTLVQQLKLDSSVLPQFYEAVVTGLEGISYGEVINSNILVLLPGKPKFICLPYNSLPPGSIKEGKVFYDNEGSETRYFLSTNDSGRLFVQVCREHLYRLKERHKNRRQNLPKQALSENSVQIPK